MFFVFVSFVAGALTVLAPCILPLLPVIIGGSTQDHHKRSPYLITLSLAISIVVFTLALKFSTAFINVPQTFWSAVSGTIIILFGLVSLFPELWEKVSGKFKFSNRSNDLLTTSATRHNSWGDILIGASLGPVFSSCSPTYFIILATVLPQSFAEGILNLAAYAIGLSVVLLLISLLGQRLVKKLGWAANPHGWFKRLLGIIFILVGLFIITGYDKQIQTYLIEKGIYAPSAIEMSLINRAQEKNIDPTQFTPTKSKPYPRYREIVNPGGYVNTSDIKLGDLIGKKVILVDFMTYSCINCIRTFPYLNAWYEKYQDLGFEIVGIHTPEFAFEHKQENVAKAMKRYGIKFPIVLDNEYGTWSAYQNSYWPRKYLIDIDGYIVYDHIGEGNYEETEKKIQELLDEKMARAALPSSPPIPAGLVNVAGTDTVETISPETYFGYERNQLLANGAPNQPGLQTFVEPRTIKLNQLYFAGAWNLANQYAQNQSAPAKIIFRYGAKNVYIVTSAAQPITIRVLQNGRPLTTETAGSDIIFKDGQSLLIVQNEQLYHIIRNQKGISENNLELIIETPGLEVYTFTFG